MEHNKLRRILPISLMLLFSPALSVHARDSRAVTVFAASSLTDALLEIAGVFEAEQSGVTPGFNFGGLSRLVAQFVEGGASGDVFVGASPRQMQAAVEGGRIRDRRYVYAAASRVR